MPRLKCTGWWEQQGYGRQVMSPLVMDFEAGRFTGSGIDIVGEFSFSGWLDGSEIALRKQYLGQHHVDYHGISDGEGTYHGHWEMYGETGGRWLIHIESSLSDESQLSIEFVTN